MSKTKSSGDKKKKQDLSILERISDAYVQVDKEDIYLYVNEKAAQIIGRKASEMIGKHMWSEFPDSVGQPYWFAYQEAVETGEHRYLQQYFPPWDRWYEVHIHPSDDGRIILFNDITDKKKAEHTIFENNKQLRLLESFIDNSTDAFQVATEDGSLIYINEESANRLGISQDEVSQYKVSDFETIFQKEGAWEHHVEHLRRYKKMLIEGVNKNQTTGETFPVEVTVAYENLDGRGYIIAISRDITERKQAEQKLLAANAYSYNVIESMNDGFIKFTPEGVIEDVNHAFCDMIGYTKANMLGSAEPHVFWPEDHAECIQEVMDFCREGKFEEYELEFVRKSGVRIPVIFSPSQVIDEEGKPGNIIATVKDISERHFIEQQVKESEARLRAVLEFSDLGIWDYHVKTGQTIRSEQHDKCFGFENLQDDWSTDLFMNLIHPDDRQRVLDYHSNFLDKGSEYRMEYRVVWPDESVHWIYAAGNVLFDELGNPDRIIGIVQEITTRKEHELEIEESIKEKETLLAEIHHRVKNNLAVVSGLMQLQTYETRNQEVIERLNSSINRIKSIALIHEELYKSHSFSQVSLKKNIEDLIQNIAAVSDPEEKVKVELELSDVNLDINQALPCALIINEAVTNAYKHAFNGDKKGVFRIELKLEGEEVQLTIRDNGPGLPADFQPNEAASMGFNLIHSLAEQLDGHIRYHNEDGLVVHLRFNNFYA